MKTVIVAIGVPDYVDAQGLADWLRSECRPDGMLPERSVVRRAVVEQVTTTVAMQELVGKSFLEALLEPPPPNDRLRAAAAREPARRRESGRPCGCDPGADWTCEEHRRKAEAR